MDSSYTGAAAMDRRSISTWRSPKRRSPPSRCTGGRRFAPTSTSPRLTLQPESFMALAAIVHMPASRQPDTERFRLWELPGASDVDTYLDIGPGDLGNSPDTATLLLTTVVKKPDGDPL